MSLTGEQRKLRRTGLTGTDMPAICGLDPHRSAFDVYAAKVLPEKALNSR